MKLNKKIGFLAFFLGVLPLLSTVVVDEPTIVDAVAQLYQKAQALQNEFPELAETNRCEEFQKYIERGKPVHPLGAPRPEVDRVWAHQRERLNLLCNFEKMWVKIKSAAKSPRTTSQSYISALITTLAEWEIIWRALNNEVIVR